MNTVLIRNRNSLNIQRPVYVIRNLLDEQQNLDSDTEDEEEFVPSNKALSSSSDDDEMIHGDESVQVEKGRRCTAGTLVPRSKKNLSTTRTCRKTPNKKVK